MLFFFKKSEIVIDCFTWHAGVYDSYRPLPASKFIPAEWRSLPKQIDAKAFPDISGSTMTIPNATLKTCDGFLNLFSSGFIIQMWADLYLEIDSNGSFRAASPSNAMQLDTHNRVQFWDSFYSQCAHIKITPPWVIKEKTGVKFMWSPCTWHNTDMAGKFHILTGILDYKYQHSTAINMFIPKDSNVKFSAGQPMAQVVPLSDKKIVLKHHLVSKDEYTDRFCHQETYTKLHAEHKRAQELLDNDKAKCPFGFK